MGQSQVGEGALNRDDVLDIILGQQSKRLQIGAQSIEAVLKERDSKKDSKKDDFEAAIAAVEDEDDR